MSGIYRGGLIRPQPLSDWDSDEMDRDWLEHEQQLVADVRESRKIQVTFNEQYRVNEW